tara:strand:- start:568 stop:1503 length:936 start_codon:yes stop_codon:yes gene_type:complete
MRKAWETKFAKLGKISLRQSSIRKFRYCPKQYYYDMQGTDDNYAKPVYFTLGSYVHQYIEEYTSGLKPEPERILMECFEKDVKVDADFNDLLWRIDNKEIFYGMSLNDLAVKTCVYLDTMGFEPERIEKKEHMQLGALSITGTPDLVSVNRLTGERYVLDIKTSGLWKRFMGSGSLSAVKYAENQITFATQLQHYDWMLYRLHGIKADRYGYVCPVNFIPVTSGKNAGKLRGEPISIAPAATLEQLTEIYEYDLYGTAREIARCIESNEWPRSRPETYGKLDCVTCRHRDKCLGQRELSVKMPSFIDEDLG